MIKTTILVTIVIQHRDDRAHALLCVRKALDVGSFQEDIEFTSGDSTGLMVIETEAELKS